MDEYIKREDALDAVLFAMSGTGYQSRAISAIHDVPTADVVSKSEADNWYQLYHSIKEELKQEKMYHRETDNLCDRYYIESQQAKRQVAREIFEEIEKVVGYALCVDLTDWSAYTDLKKKYTEGENEDQRGSY